MIGRAIFNSPLLIQCKLTIQCNPNGEWNAELSSANCSDGFALNIGSDDWMSARVADAYSAAQSLGSSFKLFLSLDMT
jgi:hypothetical protein